MASTTATRAELWRLRPSPDGGSRGWLLIGGAALLEALIGAGIASSHSKYAIGLVVAAVACGLVWRFPLAGCFGFMFLAAGIINPSFFVFHAGGHTFYGDEAVLLVLLLRATIRPRRRTWGGAAGGWLAAFFAVLILATLLAVRSHATSLNNALIWGRVFFVMTYFWVVVRLAPDRERLGALLVAGIVLGALSGVVGLILAVTHDASTVFQSSGVLGSTSGGLLRVRTPGLGIGFVLLWVAILWLSRGRRPRWVWIVSLPWILVDIVVSQNRNMWVVGTLSLILVLLIVGPRVRGRLVASLVILCAAIAVLIAVPQGGASSTPLSPIVARASTILNPNAVAASSSATDRDYEDSKGWANAKHHLAIGIGPGVYYGATIGTGSGSDVGVTPRLFVQNQYLYLLVITGIPGAVAWMLFLLTTMRNAFVGGAPMESRLLGIGVLALSLTAIVMLSFTDPGFLTPLSLAAAAIFLLRPRAAATAPFVGQGSVGVG